MIVSMKNRSYLRRKSFIELNARERANDLLDGGCGRELAGPFDHAGSPWLPMQGIAPQADDGCVVVKGAIDGAPVVVIALEGAFQGGSVGEVSGAKMNAALDLAAMDCAKGRQTAAVLLLETGGVRLQEANLGLAAVSEVIASILALRLQAPVITLIAGTVGCFGGMSLAAGVSSYVVMTREARLGLNGPEVIEQESGLDEFDAADREMIWAIHGGEQRVAMGVADVLADDDADQIRTTVRRLLKQGQPARYRSQRIAEYAARIAAIDTSTQIDPQTLRTWPNDIGEEVQ